MLDLCTMATKKLKVSLISPRGTAESIKLFNYGRVLSQVQDYSDFI
jgi:hypothetical protein